MRVRFLKSSSVGGCRYSLGEIADIDQIVARELINRGKAAPVDGSLEFATDSPDVETADGE